MKKINFIFTLFLLVSSITEVIAESSARISKPPKGVKLLIIEEGETVRFKETGGSPYTLTNIKINPKKQTIRVKTLSKISGKKIKALKKGASVYYNVSKIFSKKLKFMGSLPGSIDSAYFHISTIKNLDSTQTRQSQLDTPERIFFQPCKTNVACIEIYAPVCGTLPDGRKGVFGNTCEASVACAMNVLPGESEGCKNLPIATAFIPDGDFAIFE